MARYLRYVGVLLLFVISSTLARGEEDPIANFYTGPISPADYQYMNACPRVSSDAVNSALKPGETPGVQSYEANVACTCKSRLGGKDAEFDTHYLNMRSRFCRPHGEDPNAVLVAKGPTICTNEYIRKFPGRFDYVCTSNSRIAWLDGVCTSPSVAETVILPAQSTLPPVAPSAVLDRLVSLKFRCNCDQHGIYTLPFPSGQNMSPKFELSVCQKAGVTSGDMNVFADSYCAASCDRFVRNNAIPDALPRGSVISLPELYYSGAECVQETGELTITVDGPGTVTGGPINCNSNCTARYCTMLVNGQEIRSLPSLTAQPIAPATWCQYTGTDYKSTGPLSFVPKGGPIVTTGEGENLPTGNHFVFRSAEYKFTLSGEPHAKLTASPFTPGIDITKRSGVNSGSMTGVASLGEPVLVNVEIISNSSKVGFLSAPDGYTCEKTGEFQWQCTSDTSRIPAESIFKVAVREKKIRVILKARHGAIGTASVGDTTCTASSVFGTDCGVVNLYSSINATAGSESFISESDFKDVPHTVSHSTRRSLSARIDGYGSEEITEIVITFDREEKAEATPEEPPPSETEAQQTIDSLDSK